MRTIAALLTIAMLAACGSREPLTRPKGDPVPPTPYAADKAPTSDELITSDTQARPDRSDEILRRSQRREDDRFDLPPTTD